MISIIMNLMYGTNDYAPLALYRARRIINPELRTGLMIYAPLVLKNRKLEIDFWVFYCGKQELNRLNFFNLWQLPDRHFQPDCRQAISSTLLL